jgi:hypothetical protein
MPSEAQAAGCLAHCRDNVQVEAARALIEAETERSHRSITCRTPLHSIFVAVRLFSLSVPVWAQTQSGRFCLGTRRRRSVYPSRRQICLCLDSRLGGKGSRRHQRDHSVRRRVPVLGDPLRPGLHPAELQHRSHRKLDARLRSEIARLGLVQSRSKNGGADIRRHQHPV